MLFNLNLKNSPITLWGIKSIVFFKLSLINHFLGGYRAETPNLISLPVTAGLHPGDKLSALLSAEAQNSVYVVTWHLMK